MKKSEAYAIIYGTLLVFILLFLVLATGCAPRKGDMGPKGDTGAQGASGAQGIAGTPGSSCTVVSETYGALIACSDGTSVSVYNGTNGQNGHDGADGKDCEKHKRKDKK